MDTDQKTSVLKETNSQNRRWSSSQALAEALKKPSFRKTVLAQTASQRNIQIISAPLIWSNPQVLAIGSPRPNSLPILNATQALSISDIKDMSISDIKKEKFRITI